MEKTRAPRGWYSAALSDAAKRGETVKGREEDRMESERGANAV